MYAYGVNGIFCEQSAPSGAQIKKTLHCCENVKFALRYQGVGGGGGGAKNEAIIFSRRPG